MTRDAVRLDIRVMPRSPRARLDGFRDGRLIVRVTAPPADGEANRAVIDLLAAALHIPRQAIRMVSGASGRNKTIEIQGVTPAQIAASPLCRVPSEK